MTRAVLLKTPLRRALGLMFRRPAPETLYLFDFHREVRASFHMWFVFWPIDLHLFDSGMRLVERRFGFLPFTTHIPHAPFRYAVESTPGTLKLRIGERFDLRTAGTVSSKIGHSARR